MALDSTLGKYTFEEVWEYPSATAAQIHEATMGMVQPENIFYESDGQVTIRFTWNPKPYHFLVITETLQWKDGKFRWMIHDVYYLFKATEFSQAEPIEEVSSRKLPKVLDLMDEYITKARAYMKGHLDRSLSSKDDW